MEVVSANGRRVIFDRDVDVEVLVRVVHRLEHGDDPDPDGRPGVAGNRLHRHAQGLPGPVVAGTKANPPKAGLRPKRNGTYKLAPEPSDGRLIVHNYGHAGAGITMSWGCAIEVAQIIAAAGHGAGEEVAVLGGGVIGLTAAVILAERGFKFTVFAKDYPPNTTSNVAGGQWASASVQHNDKAQFELIPLPSGVRVWLATGHTDMRKGFAIAGLALANDFRRWLEHAEELAFGV